MKISVLTHREIADTLTRCTIRAATELQFIKRDSLAHAYKDGNELVTSADLASHKILLSMLKDHFPDVPLIMEEQENASEIPADCLVVDELDGTIVFASGGIDWGVTCAYIEAGNPVAATIYLPDRDIIVSTSRGGGTWVNGSRVQFEKLRPLGQSILMTEINSHMNSEDFRRLFILSKKVRGLRALASATASAIELLLGRGHLYLNARGGKIWDFAAGALAVVEAGGAVANSDGRTLKWDTLKMGVLMASTDELLDEARRIQVSTST